jgi:hypothetical protein
MYGHCNNRYVDAIFPFIYPIFTGIGDCLILLKELSGLLWLIDTNN